MYKTPQQIRLNYSLQNRNPQPGQNTRLENLAYGMPGQRPDRGVPATYGNPLSMKPINPLESVVLAYNAGAINKPEMEFAAKATVAAYVIGLLPREIQKPMYQGLAKMVVNYLTSGQGKTKALTKSRYKP